MLIGLVNSSFGQLVIIDAKLSAEHTGKEPLCAPFIVI